MSTSSGSSDESSGEGAGHARLSLQEECKVWALLWVNRQNLLKKKLTSSDIAGMVHKTDGSHPTRQAVDLIGNKYQAKKFVVAGGAKKKIKKRGKKKNDVPLKQKKRISKVAMKIKNKGAEPSAAEVLRQAPQACTNAATGEYLSERSIQRIMGEHCYDNVPTKPWKHQNGLSRTAISEGMLEKRKLFAEEVLELGKSGNWYGRHVVYFDPCSTILPGSKKKADLLAHSAKNKKGKRWVSDDAKEMSRNLQGSSYAKQCSFGDRRARWWAVLSRGKFGVLVQPESSWTKDDLVWFVDALENLLVEWFGDNALPRVLMSDRGMPMYSTSGHTSKAYRDILGRTDFRPFTSLGGNEDNINGQWQPAAIADILPHETAISWFKALIRPNGTYGCLKHNETLSSFRRRVEKACEHINTEYQVKDLCCSFPRRCQEVHDKGGDRLKH